MYWQKVASDFAGCLVSSNTRTFTHTQTLTQSDISSMSSQRITTTHTHTQENMIVSGNDASDAHTHTRMQYNVSNSFVYDSPSPHSLPYTNTQWATHTHTGLHKQKPGYNHKHTSLKTQ